MTQTYHQTTSKPTNQTDYSFSRMATMTAGVRRRLRGSPHSPEHEFFARCPRFGENRKHRARTAASSTLFSRTPPVCVCVFVCVCVRVARRHASHTRPAGKRALHDAADSLLISATFNLSADLHARRDTTVHYDSGNREPRREETPADQEY